MNCAVEREAGVLEYREDLLACVASVCAAARYNGDAPRPIRNDRWRRTRIARADRVGALPGVKDMHQCAAEAELKAGDSVCLHTGAEKTGSDGNRLELHEFFLCPGRPHGLWKFGLHGGCPHPRGRGVPCRTTPSTRTRRPISSDEPQLDAGARSVADGARRRAPSVRQRGVAVRDRVPRNPSGLEVARASA